MMWQDMVFLIGSMTSVMFLYPTLRNAASQVPRATSIPSMLIGGAYSFTFLTLGMTFSAAGSFAACTMWSLIAAFRAPDSGSLLDDPKLSKVVDRLGLGVSRSGEMATEQSFEGSTDEDAGAGMNESFENDLDIAANSD